VLSPEVRYKELQSCMSRLGGAVARERDVVSFLLGLVEEAIDRLTCDDNSERPVILLPQLVADTPGETTIKVKDIALYTNQYLCGANRLTAMNNSVAN